MTTSILNDMASPLTLPAERPSSSLVRLAIRNDERVIFVRTADVEWFEADGNYVKVYANGQIHRLRTSLRELAARLDPSAFRRIHRSWLVNLDRVREIQPWFSGDYVVIMHGGRQLRVSRTYAASLLEPLQ